MSSNRFDTLVNTSKPASPAPNPPVASASNSTPTERPKAKKRKGHRGGKKKRSRRKSFAALDEDDGHDESHQETGEGFYKMPAANLSGTSIDSETLLDHRDHQPLRVRRASTAPGPPSPYVPSFTGQSSSRLRTMPETHGIDDQSEPIRWDETAPLLGESRKRGSHAGLSNYGANDPRSSRPRSRGISPKSSTTRLGTSTSAKDRYDVNHPPSMPGSPTFGASDRIEMSFGDVMIRDEISLRNESPRHSVADIDEMGGPLRDMGGPLRETTGLSRRAANEAEQDVCFPGPGMSEMGDDDNQSRTQEPRRFRTRRRRGQWPDLSFLEEWSHMEKEGRSDERRVKRITEPQLINGRLRPVRKGWYQTDVESPYRFTYFNEEFPSTIHSQSISELVQPGGGFRELFMPDPVVLSSDEESDDDDDPLAIPVKPHFSNGGLEAESKTSTRQPSLSATRDSHNNTDVRPEMSFSPPRDPLAHVASRSDSGRATPSGQKSSEDSMKPTQTTFVESKEKIIRYGDRPVWWLDVLCPTEPEMKAISKAFGIHPLTAEDIMLQEAREKVELFRHYYFVNYRSFDQDNNSENFLEPVDMYVVVFREGVLSFHFSMTPHPANVRRRIRQLRDYLILSSDWISYAIIDDITDVFQPLIQNIEDEVDEIDDVILKLHSSAEKRLKNDPNSSKTDDAVTVSDPSSDMLRRVGDCRKRVMSLYRLLGNKADVIKGFAKRCNERWDVAPRSEIGLYLGDIQDHIITMTSNLGHYEKILARSHGNYLAQINIRMNERQEQTADVLGKLTVLGTIVLPMNIITGLWGMNVWVPGQEYEGDLVWFFWITAGLIAFGLACFLIAKRVYNIV
ncbi:CorA metal ion transporter [Neonectria punicea]|uniref:CorA metal ion transporter n=1 Tax=Neonectria punicea TaxID=979145 RepID=A0ABR1H3G6_9HYPO